MRPDPRGNAETDGAGEVRGAAATAAKQKRASQDGYCKCGDIAHRTAAINPHIRKKDEEQRSTQGSRERKSRLSSEKKQQREEGRRCEKNNDLKREEIGAHDSAHKLRRGNEKRITGRMRMMLHHVVTAHAEAEKGFVPVPHRVIARW